MSHAPIANWRLSCRRNPRNRSPDRDRRFHPPRDNLSDRAARRTRFRAPDGETEVDQRTINWLLPLFAPTVVYHRIRPQVLVTERVEAPAWFCAGANVAAENHLLSLLDPSTRSLLEPHMRTITVEHGEVLHGSSSASNSPTSRNPPSSRSSQHRTGPDRRDFHRWPRGNDRFVFDPRHYDFICRVHRSSRRRSCARTGFGDPPRRKASESFRKIVALFDLSLLAQAQQSTACQALHQVEPGSKVASPVQ
jgi:hypothetical protein